MKYRYFLLVMFAGLVTLLTVYASGKLSNPGPEQTPYQAALRLVGHQLLLSAGDTKSRVLPIKELPGQKFQIRFENPVFLEPDSIFKIINKTFKLHSLPDQYTAEVLKCSDDEVVYSFVMSSLDSNNIIPCLGRTLPAQCYYIGIDFGSTTSQKSQILLLWAIGVVVLLITAFLLFRSRKAKIPSPTDQGINVIKIGQFLFYPDQQHLQLNQERIVLTPKESKLLSILSLAPNKTIEREKLQKEVWENEGVIVTRSLDVFISRLRKKLEKDTSIRLTNVHGKGYKLELG